MFTGTVNIGQGNTQISHGISNLKKCVKIDVCFETQAYFLPYLWGESTASSTKITCVNYVNANGVGIQSTNSWGNDKLIFIMEYTKTTD